VLTAWREKPAARMWIYFQAGWQCPPSRH